MHKLKVKKTKEKKLIWSNFKYYIDLVILACCCIIAINIHPSNNEDNFNQPNPSSEVSEKSKMIYIFHDYDWNEYTMNDNIHGAADSFDYLFDDEIPSDLKWEEYVKSVSLSGFSDNANETLDTNTNSDSIKDNQVSIDDIMSDLWINPEGNDNSLNINLWEPDEIEDDTTYTVKQKTWNNNSVILIIEKIDTSDIKHTNNNENDNSYGNASPEEENHEINSSNEEDWSTAKAFTFIEEWWILPTLIPRNDLYFWGNNSSLTYLNHNWNDDKNNDKGITIIDDYADCMTPWWYKIAHWDSVLAYKQMDNAPDICNIERRFCWKWKLSGTYTQQWCSINENYTYEQWGEAQIAKNSEDNDEFKWRNTIQNEDGSVKVKDSEIWWSFVLDRPVNSYSAFHSGDNIREEDPEVSQTTRPHRNCTAPRWEKVDHWQFVQAFKHANWFSDAPCEAQIRLCTMWELKWTYTESTCKTWNTSFIDWVNWSPNRWTYSKEKIDWVKKQIKNEWVDYEKARKNADRSTTSDALDKILWILDQD